MQNNLAYKDEKDWYILDSLLTCLSKIGIVKIS